MSSDMALAIKSLVQDTGISEELVLKTVEEILFAAYKRKFGTDENAVVKFSEDGAEVTIYAKKQIVDDQDVDNPVMEIELKDALAYNSECEIGDELLIEINPKEFDRVAIQSAKQKAKQKLREIQKDTLYSEFKEKEGEMVIGYYQRERNGNIYVDLGKTEGILPKKYQSPREVYHLNDRIKALIFEVAKTPTGLQIALSRTHPEFVKRIFELEVPEIYDKTVDIFRVVREPGYRTKIAVYSNREDVDPVGACVGLKGVRIQAIVKEMEGEKVDILKYDSDPKTFIKNALSPAEIVDVLVLDEAKKQALVIVTEQNFALAIGKQGLNVRLANKLVDWNIDVKTETQFSQMDIAAETKKAVSALFRDYKEEISRVSELPGISPRIVDLLKRNKVELIEEIVSLTKDEIEGLEGVTENDAKEIMKIIEDNVEIVEEEGGAEGKADRGQTEGETEETETTETAGEAADDEENYECPMCGASVTPSMVNCPKCGVGLSFEDDEEGDEEKINP